MPTVTATQVMNDAFADLNVYLSGETVSSTDSTDFLRRLNLFVGQLANQNLTIPSVARLVCTLLSGVGSSTNPYTLGPGGSLQTTAGATVARPTGQNSVVGAGLLLNASTPPIEIPRGLYTHAMWEAERIKDLTSTLFTAVYYRPDYANQLGSLFLWPVPTDLTNNLVLYIEQPLGTFADLTTSYAIPDGFDDMLHYNMAVRIAVPYGRAVSADLRALAMETLAAIKRTNMKLEDMTNDFSAIGGQTRKTLYNIQTGENSY